MQKKNYRNRKLALKACGSKLKRVASRVGMVRCSKRLGSAGASRLYVERERARHDCAEWDQLASIILVDFIPNWRSMKRSDQEL